jgi:long-chain fatty acid transport protein
MLKKKQVVVAAGLMGLVMAGSARADQFHYNNFLMGTRAVGLGGAFAAVADDASGIVYNPAGLAFSLSNDISGSANAFYNKTVTYKGALGREDFVEKSGGSLPSFFGGLQKLDKVTPGLVAGFGIYTVDNDLKDQDDLYEDLEVGTLKVKRYHRTANARASTYHIGAAAALRFGSTFSVGFGLSYFNVSELTQNYQDVKTGGTAAGSNSSTVDVWKSTTVATRESLNAHGVEPTLGIQVALPANLALGLVVRKGFLVSQTYDRSTETHSATVAQSNDATVDANRGEQVNGLVGQQITDTKSKKPFGNWPGSVRLGLAWFASTKLMLTTDATYYEKSSGADKLGASSAPYERKAVTNYAAGAEYYVLSSIPLRFGLFTNNDARPKLSKGKVGQADHIDYIGETLFIAWVQPNSQIAVGVVLQQGEGEAQKRADTEIQKVTAESNTFAFSATHNF